MVPCLAASPIIRRNLSALKAYISGNLPVHQPLQPLANSLHQQVYLRQTPGTAYSAAPYEEVVKSNTSYIPPGIKLIFAHILG